MRAREHGHSDALAHEQVIRVGRVAADAEQLRGSARYQKSQARFRQIVKLSVDVAADGHRAADGLDVRLVHQNFPRFVAKLLDIRLREAGR